MSEVQRLKDRLEAEKVYLQGELRKDHNFEEMVGNDNHTVRVSVRVPEAE